MPDSTHSSHPGIALLTAFAAGKLAAAERAALKAHLSTCPACRQALAALPSSSDSLRGEETLAHGTGVSPVSSATGERPVPQAAPPGLTETYRPEAAVPPELAQHPRYEVLYLLGQGGMGAVYKARHRKMDRLVALKVIRVGLLDNPRAIERFQREVKAAARLDHPNIVRAYDADEAGGTHFLVMEFVEGTDLARYVQQRGPLPVASACHFIRQAAQGLQHAHEKGMVHRDVKPHNLMLTRSPRASEAEARGEGDGAQVKVMDFGLARLACEQASTAGLTGDNMLMGTADYIAPEQAQDAHRADIRSDIYSLGCSLCHLLAGRSLLAGGSVAEKLTAHLTGQLPLAAVPAAVPAELRSVLVKMVAREPAQRFQTPGEAAAALAPFVTKPPAGDGNAATLDEQAIVPGRPSSQETRPRRWRLLLVVGASVAALLLLAVSALLLNRGRPPAEVVTQETNRPVAPGLKQPQGLPATFTNQLGMEFVLVPKGEFLMGGEGGRVGPKEVTIAHDFYLGKYEVTQGEWEAVTGNNPSYFSRKGNGKDAVKDVPDAELKRFPVEQVSWGDAQLFLAGLNEQTKESGWMYRLPTEAEWEYSCRGGPASNPFDYGFDFYFDKPSRQLLPEQANFNQLLKRTCGMGSYMPNGLGLHDMHGNVREWCADEEPADPEDPKGASRRVSRGGSWGFDRSWLCRAAQRFAYEPWHRYNIIGVRLARVPSAPGSSKTSWGERSLERRPTAGAEAIATFRNLKLLGRPSP
jgi:serine/threonine protein kinase